MSGRGSKWQRSRELRARRRALRGELKKRRRAVRTELARRRKAAMGPAMRRRRRRRRLSVLLLLLLLLLLRRCSCAEPPPPPPDVATPVIEQVPVPTVAELEGQAPLKGRIARRDRPDYASKAPEVLPWLASFRMQVSARSPRLAACFEGVSRPGALKWTAAVEPVQGLVSDQDVEPTLSSDELTRAQRTCVFDVLSDPPYRLETEDPRATPSRVGLVIEF